MTISYTTLSILLILAGISFAVLTYNLFQSILPHLAYACYIIAAAYIVAGCKLLFLEYIPK